MFLDLCEEVVPSSDDLALVLVVYQLQLVSLPCRPYLVEERRKEEGGDGRS